MRKYNLTEKELKKIVSSIKEAPIDYGDYPERMDPSAERKLGDPESFLAKSGAMRRGAADVERLGGTRFKEIVDYVKRYFGLVDSQGRPKKDVDLTNPNVKQSLMTEMMMAVRKVMSKEVPHREELKKLAVEIAAKEEGWLSYSKTLDQAIEDGTIRVKKLQTGTKYAFEFIDVIAMLGEQKVDPSSFKMKPPKEKPKFELPPNFSFDVDELTPDEKFELEVQKRHIINTLIQGRGKRGQFAYQAFLDRLNEIDPQLAPLYNKIMSVNDLLYFTDEQLIEMLGGNAAGSSQVVSSSDDEDEDEGGDEEMVDKDTTVLANGLIFPILLHELVKGFASVASREQWRGMDPAMADLVKAQTDIFSYEPMQFRVGGELSRKLKELLPDELVDLDDRKVLPFFERILYGVPAEEFLKKIIANVVSDDPKDNERARREFKFMYDKAMKDYRISQGEEDDDEEDDDGDILKKLGF